MMQRCKFVLIEHLQVSDEPLSSLYADRESGKYYLSVRLYEDMVGKSYLFLEVTPDLVLKYMNRQIGLKVLCKMKTSFYYRADGHYISSINNLLPLSQEEGCRKLSVDGSLDDMYDIHLAYRSVNLKNYLARL